MNFYPFNTGDYAGSTRHLSWTEDLAYRRMLDAYYIREAPLPLEKRAIYRLVIASSTEQREAVDTVLAEFFHESDSGWMHPRCEEEIARAQSKKAKAALSAHARWGHAAPQPDALPTQSERSADASNDTCERIEKQKIGNAPNPNPNPNKEEKARKRGEKKCPDEFQVSEDLKTWAAEKVPGLDIEAETDKFRDWEFKVAKTDWAATWRTWMRRAYGSEGPKTQDLGNWT